MCFQKTKKKRESIACISNLTQFCASLCSAFALFTVELRDNQIVETRNERTNEDDEEKDEDERMMKMMLLNEENE